MLDNGNLTFQSRNFSRINFSAFKDNEDLRTIHVENLNYQVQFARFRTYSGFSVTIDVSANQR